MNFDSDRSPPHDRSIFRKNIGRAILNKENNPYLDTWNIDFTTRANREKYSHLRDTTLEKRTEIKVSEQLCRNFSFRFIILETEEGRKGTSGMESRLIGTLSRCQICSPSDLWLGKHSPVEKIRNRACGLYNTLIQKN